MAETHGLSVVHIEPVRRIARRVAMSPAPGRYLAIGASPELRERVRHAFVALLGAEEKVVSIDLSGSTGDPWNEVRRYQLEHGLGTRGILYIVHGLRDMASAAAAGGRAHPYAQLNLSRDAWGATGTHLLVWLEGLAEFDAFLGSAPDLWSHRDVVAWFLTRVDFQDLTLSSHEVSDGIEPRLRGATDTLENPTTAALERVLAAAELALMRGERGEPIAAWEAIAIGDRATRSVDLTAPGATAALDELALRRISTLILLNRSCLAVSEARAWLGRHGAKPWWQRAGFLGFLAAALKEHHIEEALPVFRDLLRGPPDSPFGAESSLLLDAAGDNFLVTLLDAGRVRDARKALASDLTEGGLWPSATAGNAEAAFREAWLCSRRGWIAESQGDYSAALRQLEQAGRLFASGGRWRSAAGVRTDAGIILDQWGDLYEAEALLEDAAHGAASVDARGAQARLWFAHRCRASGSADALLAKVVASIESHAYTWAGRGLAVASCEQLVDLLDGAVDPDDPVLAAVEHPVIGLRAAARRDADPEIEGHARWLLAELALLQGDAPAAHRLADKVLIAWSRRWRGPLTEVDIWRLLARSAPSPTQATEHAARAVKLADASPSIYARIRARQTAAEVESRAGRTEGAAAALQAALSIARTEGLRRQELAVLHDLAELAGYPGAGAAANEALTLASSLLLPRDEARALLNLAVVSPDGASSSLARRRLDRALEIVDALGPPKLRARVHARVLALSQPA